MTSREPKPILIFPFNGNGVEALDCLGEARQLIGFIDDTPKKQGTTPQGYRVFGRTALQQFPAAEVLAVPGSPASYRARRRIIGGLGIEDSRFATVIHPVARVSPLAIIGRNVLIMAGAVITSNAVIGNHVCILPNSVIHHDVVVGDFSLIGSNVTIAGGAVIGENCYVGSGASVMSGLTVGNGALVGLGSNVIRPVGSGTKVVGNPAREIV
jgi:sugar O-acyltransferase (sialic acid O-acetyltransferase NeuD family)